MAIQQPECYDTYFASLIDPREDAIGVIAYDVAAERIERLLYNSMGINAADSPNSQLQEQGIEAYMIGAIALNRVGVRAVLAAQAHVELQYRVTDKELNHYNADRTSALAQHVRLSRLKAYSLARATEDAYKASCLQVSTTPTPYDLPYVSGM